MSMSYKYHGREHPFILTRDITLLADTEKNLALIMKDGKIYKNTLN